jgi:hypothetical protein
VSPALDGDLSSLRSEPAARAEPAEAQHRRLAAFNDERLGAGFADGSWSAELHEELQLRLQEVRFVESERRGVRADLAALNADPAAVASWFARLAERPAAADASLFHWLAETASLEQMRWFLSQAQAVDNGLARLPTLVGLRLGGFLVPLVAEGDGAQRAVLWQRLRLVLRLPADAPESAQPLWQVLAINNLLLALAVDRRYAYQALGALAALVLTTPARARAIDRGLQRLGLSAPAREYFRRLADGDARNWAQAALPTLAADARAARALLEGSLLYLRAAQRCWTRCGRQLGAGGGALN